MSYFEYFGEIAYTDKAMADITKRAVFAESLINNDYLSFVYEVKEGESPESLAFDYYGDAELNWVILMYNQIIDPFFGWTLTQRELIEYATALYGDLESENGGYGGIHHWEYNNAIFDEVKEAITVTVVDGGSGYALNDILSIDYDFIDKPLVKVTGVSGTTITDLSIEYAGIVANTSSSPYSLTKLSTQDAADVATVTLTFDVPATAIPVSNMQYEESINDVKRQIRIPYPSYVSQIRNELEYVLAQ